jgi:hypothetical protein
VKSKQLLDINTLYNLVPSTHNNANPATKPPTTAPKTLASLPTAAPGVSVDAVLSLAVGMALLTRRSVGRLIRTSVSCTSICFEGGKGLGRNARPGVAVTSKPVSDQLFSLQFSGSGVAVHAIVNTVLAVTVVVTGIFPVREGSTLRKLPLFADVRLGRSVGL